MKKLLAILLTCAMLLSLSIAPISAEESAGSAETATDYSDYTEITSADQLFTATPLSGKYVLKNDLDMTGVTLRAYLTGGAILDGNGHSLINHSGGTIFALLGAATIRNLTMGSADKPFVLSSGAIANDDPPADILWENVSLYASSTNVQTGCFMVDVNGKHTFRNSTLTVHAECGGGGNIGGWVAYSNNSAVDLTWENCATFGSLTATASGRVGGYVANVTNQGKYTFTNCDNYASITAVDHSAAGFISWGDVNDSVTVTMTGCRNFGAVTATTDGEETYGYAGLIGRSCFQATMTDCANYGAIVGSSEVGGLAGYVNQKLLTITNCENYGTVHAKHKNAGGLIGLTDQATVSVTGSVNYGSVDCAVKCAAGVIGWVQGGNVTITGTTNRGTITSPDNAGGMVAEANGPTTMEKCLNTGKLVGTGGNIGGFVGYSDATSILTDCANIGSVSLTGGSRCANFVGGGDAKLTGCLALGTVAGTGADAFFGGEGQWEKENESTGNSYWANGTPAVKVGNAAKIESAADAIAALGDRYGYTFMAEKDEKSLVIAQPELRAVQETAKDANGFYKVRFIAVIDSLSYKYVGFKVKTALDTGELTARDDQYCQYVYRTVFATEEGVKTRYTAENLGGRYLYALSVSNVPAGGRVTFEITPFATGTDGETQYLGTTYTVVYENGQFVSSTPASGV